MTRFLLSASLMWIGLLALPRTTANAQPTEFLPPTVVTIGESADLMQKYCDCEVATIHKGDGLFVGISGPCPVDAKAVLFLDGQPIEGEQVGKAGLGGACQTFKFSIGSHIPPGVYSATVAMKTTGPGGATLSDRSAPFTIRYQPDVRFQLIGMQPGALNAGAAQAEGAAGTESTTPTKEWTEAVNRFRNEIKAARDREAEALQCVAWKDADVTKAASNLLKAEGDAKREATAALQSTVDAAQKAGQDAALARCIRETLISVFKKVFPNEDPEPKASGDVTAAALLKRVRRWLADQPRGRALLDGAANLAEALGIAPAQAIFRSAPTTRGAGSDGAQASSVSPYALRNPLFQVAPATFHALSAVQKIGPGEFTDSTDNPASRLSIYEYRFHSPAHIAWPRFGQWGGPVERDGVVIYEGMRFSAREDGMYEVAFDVQTPEAPVDLRLQFDFQNIGDGRWHTITLPPIRLPATIFQSDGAHVHRVEQRGYSSALEMAPLTDKFAMRRTGTATIGFGASQYRPQQGY